MAGQPQSYGSIREFLDNLPAQPCIWQPENPNICVTCLRINDSVARVCSVWFQALEDAPLDEIDFEDEVSSLPSVVEIEDDFEVVDPETQIIEESSAVVAEVDIVKVESDWDMEPVSKEMVAADAEAITISEDENLVLDTIQDAVEAETIATTNIEKAIVNEEEASEAVSEAIDVEAVAAEEYVEELATFWSGTNPSESETGIA